MVKAPCVGYLPKLAQIRGTILIAAELDEKVVMGHPI
jgi:hypothetical protein